MPSRFSPLPPKADQPRAGRHSSKFSMLYVVYWKKPLLQSVYTTIFSLTFPVYADMKKPAVLNKDCGLEIEVTTKSRHVLPGGGTWRILPYTQTPRGTEGNWRAAY